MEFIEKYARVEESDDEMEDDTGGDEASEFDLEFVDDETNFQDQEPTNYFLMNVTRDLREAITNQSIAQELDLVSEVPENCVSDFVDKVSYEFDEFFGFEKRIQKFNQELKIFERESKDSFYFSILYAIYYHLIKRKEDFDFCQDQEKLCEVLGKDFFEKLKSKKESSQLDLSLWTFETQCHVVNNLLMKKKIFLQVYEFRKKICYLIKKMPKGKNTAQRDLSACVEERFIGFKVKTVNCEKVN